jgi:D-amino-acid dehydrogenase
MSNIVVIGGGIVGASVAQRLLRSDVNVTIVDRADEGQATAAAAGLLPPLDHFIGVSAVLPLLKAARAYYPELLRELAAAGPGGAGYDVVGALHVATTEQEAAQLEAVASECEQRREAGFGQIGAVTRLEAAAARRLFPALGPVVAGAVHCDGAARVDGRQLLSALRAAVTARRGTWLRGRATLRVEAERVTGVNVDGTSIAADAVVVAGGAWSHALVAPLDIALPVSPQRGQLLHLELPEPSTGGWPMVVGFSTSYLLGFPNGRIVAGATRESDAGFDCRATAGGVHTVLDNALRLAPGLAHAALKEIRVGFRPSSADGKPILGASARYPNLYFATGHGGYGLEVGPYSGALVADLVLGEAPPINLMPFSIERFRQAPASR